MTEQEKMEKAMENQAETIAAEPMYCDRCNERMIFLMEDRDHAFSVGLTNILECLGVALREGVLPPLPDDWCDYVANNFFVFLNEDEETTET